MLNEEVVVAVAAVAADVAWELVFIRLSKPKDRGCLSNAPPPPRVQFVAVDTSRLKRHRWPAVLSSLASVVDDLPVPADAVQTSAVVRSKPPWTSTSTSGKLLLKATPTSENKKFQICQWSFPRGHIKFILTCSLLHFRYP